LHLRAPRKHDGLRYIIVGRDDLNRPQADLLRCADVAGGHAALRQQNDGEDADLEQETDGQQSGLQVLGEKPVIEHMAGIIADLVLVAENNQQDPVDNRRGRSIL
jgi:hypothetical protein